MVYAPLFQAVIHTSGGQISPLGPLFPDLTAVCFEALTGVRS